MVTKHRVVARITRETLRGTHEEGDISEEVIRRFNLDKYDTVEAVVPHPPTDDYFITVVYLGEETALPRKSVELISRYEED